jgi:hypothetical protein
LGAWLLAFLLAAGLSAFGLAVFGLSAFGFRWRFAFGHVWWELHHGEGARYELVVLADEKGALFWKAEGLIPTPAD